MNKELIESFNILKKVYINGCYLGPELNKFLVKAENINTKTITKICYGVVEKNIFLDYVLNEFINASTKPNIKLLLKMGVFISKFLNNIPDYALVDEIVQLAKKEEGKYVAGFVNATLKNILKATIKMPNADDDFIKFLSIHYNYPEWLIIKLIKDNGEEFTLKLLKAKITELTHIRILENHISVAEFIKTLKQNNINFEKSIYDYTLNVDYSKLIKCKKLQNMFVVQGLPSIITCNVLDAKENTSVLDACSAPGGKSVYIAERHESIKVCSCDKINEKLNLVRNFAQKLGLKNIEVNLVDATTFKAEFENRFDYVLLDVPCSNTGVILKKPDILLNKTAEDVVMLNIIQQKIIENCSKYLKKGGILVYSTCSIIKDENERLLENFVINNTQFKFYNFNIPEYNIKNVKYFTFYPHTTCTEGFFIGRIKKI